MTEGKPVVYVVDDDPSVRKALERLLRSAGHDAKTFASALEFLDFSHPDAPGCLVLDIKMPKLSGLELQDRLTDKGISFPIIFITGHGTVPASVKALKAGAMDFLQKPFEDREILDAVSRGIEKHRCLRQEQKEMKTLRAKLDTLTPKRARGLWARGHWYAEQAGCVRSRDDRKNHQGPPWPGHGKNGCPIPCGPRSLCRKTWYPFFGCLTLPIGPKSNSFPPLISSQFKSQF